MELSINVNDHGRLGPLPISRTHQRHRAITSSSSSSSVASSFLNLIYRRKKAIFFFLCCSSLILNQIFSLMHSVNPKSPQSPPSNLDFNCTQILNSPFCSPIAPISPLPLPEKAVTQEQILRLSLDSTMEALKKSNIHLLDILNRHLLDLLNPQDLTEEQKIALMICKDTNDRAERKLEMANSELSKAIDDLDFFLDHAINCRRLRLIHMFLSMAAADQDLCLQQFGQVGMIHDYHEGRSEGHNLLKTFVLDLKTSISVMLSSSLELAKGIEKDCREKIEEQKKDRMTNVSPSYSWKKRETKSTSMEEEVEEEAMDSDFDFDESFYKKF